MAEAGGQMGIATKDLESFVGVAAKMATAFKMSGEEAGTAIGTLMTVFNMSVPQVEKLGDAINVLGNTTNAKEKDIINVLTRVGGMGQQFGLAAKDLSALAASFLSLGKSPEVASTAINALLGKLSTAGIQSKEFKDGLVSIGTSANQLAADINANPSQALNSFLLKLKELPKAQQAATIGKLFGAEYADDIAAIVQSLDAYQTNLSRVANESSTAGAMQSEYNKRLETTQAQLDLMKNALNEIAVNLGSTFLPIVRLAAEAITSLSQAIATLLNNPFTATALVAGLVLIATKTTAAKLVIEALLSLLGRAGIGAGVFTTIGTAAETAAAKSGALKVAIEVLSRLSLGTLAGGVAALGVGFSLGGALAEAAYNKITAGTQRAQQSVSELVDAQRQWAEIQKQAEASGMSTAQIEQVRQLKIETLNTQAVLQQSAEFNKAANEAAMAQVQEHINRRMALNQQLQAQEDALAEAQKQKTIEVNQAKIVSLEEFITAKKQRLQEEEQAEQTAVENIKRLRQELTNQLIGDEDRMREIRRRGMSDIQKEGDIAAQAQDKMAQAREAMNNGEFELANKLADEAKSLSERLKNNTSAMNLFKEASNLDKQITEMRIMNEEAAKLEAKKLQLEIQSNIAEAQAEIVALQGEIDTLTGTPKTVSVDAQIEQAQSAIAAIQSQLDALQDKVVYVTVIEQTQQARRWGGFITDPHGNIPRFATGGKLPGYGGGDKIHALLEAGEFIVRKEAVSRYGAGALHAINNLRLPKFQNGGMVGGDASRTGNTNPDLVNIRLDLGGGRIVPFTTKREQVAGIQDAFAFIQRGAFS
jgi:TP901 family phage tail tape measure protein